MMGAAARVQSVRGCGETARSTSVVRRAGCSDGALLTNLSLELLFSPLISQLAPQSRKHASLRHVSVRPEFVAEGQILVATLLTIALVAMSAHLLCQRRRFEAQSSKRRATEKLNEAAGEQPPIKGLPNQRQLNPMEGSTSGKGSDRFRTRPQVYKSLLFATINYSCQP